MTEALQLYDQIRRPFSQKIAELSEESGLRHSLVSPNLADLTEEQSASGNALSLEQLHAIGAEVEELRAWRLRGSVEEECEISLKRLDGIVQCVQS